MYYCLFILIIKYLNIKNQNMKKNMGKVDKIIRIIIAAVILILGANSIITGALAIVLLVLAGIFIITSFISFCPLYVPFGIKTCK